MAPMLGFESRKQQRFQVMALAVTVEGGLALLALAIGWLTGVRPGGDLHWATPDVLLALAASVPLLLGFVVAVRFPVGPLKGLRSFMEQVVRPVLGVCTPWELAAISLLAGLGEELFFRGLIQAVLTDALGLAAGVILASILFGLAHPISLTYVLVAAGVGMYLGWIWVSCGNLLVPVLVHAIYDFLALCYVCYWQGNPAESQRDDMV